MGVAPRPPYSFGQLIPAYPASNSMRCQPVSHARRASQSSRCGSGPSPGSTSASHSRSSPRNFCSSAVYRRSMRSGAYLMTRQNHRARVRQDVGPWRPPTSTNSRCTARTSRGCSSTGPTASPTTRPWCGPRATARAGDGPTPSYSPTYGGWPSALPRVASRRATRCSSTRRTVPRWCWHGWRAPPSARSGSPPTRSRWARR